MTIAPYSPQKVAELCFSKVSQLDNEVLNLTKKLTHPVNESISFTDKDREEIIWKIKFIQSIQNQKRKNPHRIVEHGFKFNPLNLAR